MTRLSTALLLALCFAILGFVPARAQNDLPLPKYPQNFTVLAKEQAGFAFPMCQPGEVVAEVTGLTKPVTLLLVNNRGVTVKTQAAGVPAARLTHTLATADLNVAASAWSVVVKAGNEPASGAITIRYPAIPESVIAAYRAYLGTIKPFTFTALQPTDPMLVKTSTDIKTYLAQRNAVDPKIAVLRQEVATQFEGIRLKEITRIQSLTRPGIRLPGVSLPGGVRPTMAQLPTLISVAPIAGMPGDRIVLQTKNCGLDATKYQACFTVTNGTPPVVLTAPIEAITALANGVQEMVTHLPMAPTSVTGAFPGTVIVKSGDLITNDMPFNFTPMTIPAITGVIATPAEVRPGVQLKITGINFQQNDVLHMRLPGGQDVVVNKTFTAPYFYCTMPNYNSTDSYAVNVYITRQNGTVATASVTYYLVALPTQMDITSASLAKGSENYTLLINGYGFANPTVKFNVGGHTANATIVSVCEKAISCTVPSILCTGDTPGQFTVTCGNLTSKAMPFLYIPVKQTFILTALNAEPCKYNVIFGETNTQNWERGYAVWTDEVQAWHDTSKDFYCGKTGYDDYFPDIVLQNGYVLDNVVVTNDLNNTKAGAYLCENGMGTNSLRARIRWYGDWGGHVRYWAYFVVRGPKGFDPKPRFK